MRRVVGSLFFGLACASAQSISFTDILINGAPAGPPQVTAFGPTGLTFSLPALFQLGPGTKTLVLNYNVFASPGQVLTGVEMIPVGVVQNAQVTITAAHLNDTTQNALFTQFGGPSSAPLGSSTTSLTGNKTTFQVTTTITLDSSASAGLAHVSIYNVRYTEAVPEPASFAALSLGALALLRKRKKK
ncbi:MAG TPA: PEP-CTERM sorting domain-containing protein [Fimbriimonadaceae bacterium]|nr:PEP-CTERM sorting domain-containing protein [Fimbriimonadaceae bacterium]